MSSYDQSGGSGDQSGSEGQSANAWHFDWNQFPALTRVMYSQGDATAHLAMLGVDADAVARTA